MYCTPKVRVKSNFWGAFLYSEKFKLMLVQLRDGLKFMRNLVPRVNEEET